jgi:hypothetical protein
MSGMKLFIWEANDYLEALIVVVAPDLDAAREKFRQDASAYRENQLERDPEVVDLATVTDTMLWKLEAA